MVDHEQRALAISEVAVDWQIQPLQSKILSVVTMSLCISSDKVRYADRFSCPFALSNGSAYWHSESHIMKFRSGHIMRAHVDPKVATHYPCSRAPVHTTREHGPCVPSLTVFPCRAEISFPLISKTYTTVKNFAARGVVGYWWRWSACIEARQVRSVSLTISSCLSFHGTFITQSFCDDSVYINGFSSVSHRSKLGPCATAVQADQGHIL